MIQKNKLKQVTAIITLILLSVALTACGGNQKKEEIIPVKTTEDGTTVESSIIIDKAK